MAGAKAQAERSIEVKNLKMKTLATKSKIATVLLRDTGKALKVKTDIRGGSIYLKVE